MVGRRGKCSCKKDFIDGQRHPTGINLAQIHRLSIFREDMLQHFSIIAKYVQNIVQLLIEEERIAVLFLRVQMLVP